MAGPADGRRLSSATFAALVKDLVDGKWVVLPARVYAGDFELHSVECVRFADDPSVPMVQASNDSESLMASLGRAPYGKENICVVFEAFDIKNRKIGAWLDKAGCFNGCVAVYGLKGPSDVTLRDEMNDEEVATLSLQAFMACQGKSGPQTFRRSPLEGLLKKHFGTRLTEAVGIS